MSIVVVATLTPKPDAVDAVREALLAAVPKVHAEPGCWLSAVHEGDGRFQQAGRAVAAVPPRAGAGRGAGKGAL